MKKNLLGWLAMAAMLVGTGCSTDEVVNDYSPENAIQFGTYLGRDAQGRASIISADDLATQGFGVFTYYTDNADYNSTSSKPNFMYNQKVEGIGSGTESLDSDVTTWGNGWTYEPLKYWPNDVNDKLTFFAYAPYSDSNNTITSPETYDNISFTEQSTMQGDPIISFAVNGAVKQQTDFLISKTNNKNKVKNTGVTVEDKVNFQFVHALARIGFTVRAIVDGVSNTSTTPLDESTTIVVKKVVLAGNAGAGNNEPTEGCFFTQGTVNLNQQDVNFTNGAGLYQNVVWDTSSSASRLQKFTLENAHFVEETTDDTRGFILGIANSATAKQLNKEDSYIMIIPQNFSRQYVYVYVEYDVITTDTALGGGNSTVTNHISTPITIDFQSGKAYLLNLQLGMTSVKVTTSVEEWVSGGSPTVDVPANTTTTP